MAFRVTRGRGAWSHSLHLALLTSLALTGTASAQVPAATTAEDTLPEYVVKAGFLFNLAKYVAWPEAEFADASAPIQIGIVGEDPFGTILEQTLAEKSVKSRKFEIRRFREMVDIRSVHILFVPRSESHHVAQILNLVDTRPVLTVGEQAAFAVDGGMIAIVIENEKPSLHINPTAVERQHLEVDSKLLRIATIVGDVPER